MTWRDPKSGEKRLDRGTEWFLMRDGKIAEVRAYHHGGKKNPQGDLLGFDHAGRGYTMMEDWRPPIAVIKDTGQARPASRPSPRSTRSCASRCGASSPRRSRPTSRSGRTRASSRASCTTAAASSASSGLKFETEYGGQGGDYVHDAVWVEELSRSGGSGGVAAGLGAHAEIAMPPIWKFGTEEQKQRWLVPGIKGELVGALGITEPGAGSDVASLRTTARKVDGGYVVNGVQDLHHQRRARGLPGLRGQDHPGGRPPRHLVPGARAGHARLRGRLQAGEDGLARIRHRRALLHRRRGPRREPARRARTRASS